MKSYGEAQGGDDAAYVDGKCDGYIGGGCGEVFASAWENQELVKRKMENRQWAAVILTCGLLFAAAVAIRAQEKKGSERMVAKGPFDVKMAPAETAHKEDKAIARYSLDKLYHGDLEATGTGEMLASTGTVKGSGTYVAMEIVNGTLAGKKGTFALAHIGTQVHGEQNLSINVVPDSGTGELAGISGQLKIVIAGDGKHSYEFEYEIHK